VLVARHCLPATIAAMEEHPEEAEVVSKAMIMLGVLGQASGCLCLCLYVVCWAYQSGCLCLCVVCWARQTL
jgi:hypothetical protein